MYIYSATQGRKAKNKTKKELSTYRLVSEGSKVYFSSKFFGKNIEIAKTFQDN